MSEFNFYIKKLQDLEYRGEWKEIYSHIYEKVHAIIYHSHFLRRNFYLQELERYHEIFIDLPFTPDDEEKLIFRKTQKHIIDHLYQVREETKKIFLAQGRDTSLADRVSSILGRLKLDYVTIDFNSKKERHVKEFNSFAKECSFAIVVLSADDLAKNTEGPVVETIRVSQNVVFQLGYFLSHVGRKNLLIFYPEHKQIESPIDFEEVNHYPMKSTGDWKKYLVEKLIAAGLYVDAELMKNIL